MHTHVVTLDELGPGELSLWSHLQQTTSELANPFLSHQFAAAWARVRPRTRVAVFTDDKGDTGFFTFEPARAGVARALGQGFSDIQGLVAPATAELDARALLAGSGLRLWTFDHLLAAQGRRLESAPHRWKEERSPAVDLSDGWQAYEHGLRKASKSLQSTTARRRRSLERDHGPVSLDFNAKDHALLDQVLDWKSQQYRRTGRRDVLAAPGMRRLVHDLLDHHDHAFSAPLTVLRAGEKVVAAHLGLRSPEILAWWFPVYLPDFSRYSPGLVLTLELLQAMPEHGLRTLDLGKGDEPYKQRLANIEIPLLEGVVSRDPVSAGAWAACRWPREKARTLLRAHPRARSWVRRIRSDVATVRMRWASHEGSAQ